MAWNDLPDTQEDAEHPEAKTRPARKTTEPRQNAIVGVDGVKDSASLLCNPALAERETGFRTHQAICPNSNHGLELRNGMERTLQKSKSAMNVGLRGRSGG